MANKSISTVNFCNVNFSGDTKPVFKVENGLVFCFMLQIKSTCILLKLLSKRVYSLIPDHCFLEMFSNYLLTYIIFVPFTYLLAYTMPCGIHNLSQDHKKNK